MKKTRGSAIVMAIMLITAIGAVAFSFGRILYLEVANASLYENGVGAYYAAESGLEEGFLRYRYKTTAEVPFNSWTVGDNKGYRYNLTLATRAGTATELSSGISMTSPLYITPESQFFDLRMGAKVGTVSGDTVLHQSNQVSVNDIQNSNYGKDSLYRIKRDESKKIDLGNIFSQANPSAINLYIKPYRNSKDTTRPTTEPLDNQNCVLVEAKIVGNTGTEIQERKVLLKNSNDARCRYVQLGIITDPSTAKDYVSWGFDNTTPTQREIYRASDLKSLIAPTVTYSSATLYLKPIGADVDFLLEEPSTAAKKLPGMTNLITSTGYYGGVTRTLEANIDRQSGSLYDLFDYVIYKSN